MWLRARWVPSADGEGERKEGVEGEKRVAAILGEPTLEAMMLIDVIDSIKSTRSKAKPAR